MIKKQVSDNWGFVLLVMCITLFCLSGALASIAYVPWVASIAFMLNAVIMAGVVIKELEGTTESKFVAYSDEDFAEAFDKELADA
jgi:hypothetical protein